jgi:threonine synthase
MTHSVLLHLECSDCGERFDPRKLINLCPCGGPLLARYDLASPRLAEMKEQLPGREPTLWRYAELLPDPGLHASLGEGWTPLVPAPRTARRLGLKNLIIKDEAQNPTGSFKARGLTTAVGMAKALGATGVSLPSAGNAGSAAAAYGAHVDIPVHVFLPESTPFTFFAEIKAHGAVLHTVEGHIGDAGKAMRTEMEKEGWFDLSTLKEPYRVEGKKTMGYEIAEQLGWRMPDVILYPTGGGTGLIGMWKAFDEMEKLGWISSSRRPRMYAVQSTGCAPVVRAMNENSPRISPWEHPETVAAGLRVPLPYADKLVLAALRESGGGAVAVDESKIIPATLDLAAADGILAAPEGAACIPALQELIGEGKVRPEEEIVVFNTGSGLKYLDSIVPRA